MLSPASGMRPARHCGQTARISNWRGTNLYAAGRPLEMPFGVDINGYPITSYVMKEKSMDNPLPVFIASPGAIAKGIAARMKARRLGLGWSRDTLAARAGVSPWTLKHFELTGQIALKTLVNLAVVLDDVRGLEGLFAARAEMPASMAELEKLHPPLRKRGRTLK
jgi:DNA-binding XRE family transcriptional regulator